jgi:hypothetical protein
LLFVEQEAGNREGENPTGVETPEIGDLEGPVGEGFGGA